MSLFCYSPDGSRVAVTSADGRLTIWNNNSEIYQQYSPSAHLSSQITSLAWCPASHLKSPKKKTKGGKDQSGDSTADIIALGTSSGTVLLYSVAQGDTVTKFEAAAPSVKINCVVWSNSSKSVIVAAEDGMVSIFSVLTLELRARINTGKEAVHSVAITADDKHIISGARKIQVWEVRKQTLQQTFVGHSSEVRSLRCVNYKGETFVLSTATDDRYISVWKLNIGEKLRKKADPVYSTLSVNETIEQQESLKLGEEELLTSVTTTEGNVHLFRYSLAEKSAKPIKPTNTIKITNKNSDKSNIESVPVRANQLKNTEALFISIAYGSDGKLQLEDLKISELKKHEFIVREMPTIKLGGEENKVYSKIVQPAVPDTVRYLAKGQPESVDSTSPSSKSLKRKQEKSDKSVPSLEERLALLNSKEGILDKGVPQSDTLAQLLVQGLRSNDINILNSVLDREDTTTIDNTVRSLPVEYLESILKHLQRRIQSKASANFSHVRWTHSVVKNHAGYLISSRNIQKDILSPMMDSISVRSANYLQVLRLKGKMEMIRGEMARSSKGESINADKPPLLVFQDDSDSSDVEDRLPPQDNYDSDCLDDYLSNPDESEESDDEAEMEDIQESAVITNGHAESDMDED